MAKRGKPKLAALVILAASLAAVALLAEYTPFLENLELKNYDVLMAVVRGPVPSPEDVRIVTIDESSIQEFGAPPWPRGLYALLIDELNRAGARSITFDLVFDQPSSEEQDRMFVDAIRDSEIPVVLPAIIDVVETAQFSSVTRILPLESLLEAGAQIGYAVFNLDPDGVIRQGRLTVGEEASLALKTLYVNGGNLSRDRPPVVDYQGDDPEILINYTGGSRHIPSVSFYQAAQPQQWLPEDYFQDKVVFVGYSLAAADISQDALSDHFATPFETAGSTARMPGVEIHANLFDTLARKRYIDRIGPLALWALLMVLGVAVSATMLQSATVRRKILYSSLIVLAFLTVATILFLYNFWVLMVQPLAVMVTVIALNTLYQYRTAEKERAHIRRALSGYVSRPVMESILRNPEQLELGGEQVEATVLFSDIAGFSSIAEKSTPRELSEQLNLYFTRMGDIIMDRQGMINKYIGDAVMAVWNVPLANPDHASLACRAALEMHFAVEREQPDLKTRIGINTGSMVAGNMGHVERMEYTVIGDAVNLASRLEGANKTYHTSILLSETTHNLLNHDFLTRRVDRIQVVGKEEPVNIYQLLCEIESSLAEELDPEVNSWKEILELYDRRKWEETADCLQRHLEKFPEDRVAAVYLERCRLFCSEPPPPDWTGVFSLKQK